MADVSKALLEQQTGDEIQQKDVSVVVSYSSSLIAD